jgi:Flp pilus assembly protein TadG
MTTARRWKRRRRATSTVEFALCVSILFTVMFAMIEFSRLLQVQHAVREAALEAARTGITLDATAQTTQDRATAVLAMVGITNASITVTPIAYTSPSVSVTVSVDPSGNSWFLKFLTTGHPIKATVTLDREVQAISVPGS